MSGFVFCSTCFVLSVLSVEPYGMKLAGSITPGVGGSELSVLSVEPYGMKRPEVAAHHVIKRPFSALGRAVWDETICDNNRPTGAYGFQCSRSSRMG